MDADLQPVYEKIMQAVFAEEVFGVTDIVLPVEMLLDFLEKEYKPLKELTNPKRWSSSEDVDCATEADRKLEGFYSDAQSQLREGTYGLGNLTILKPRKKPFTTKKRTYFMGDLHRSGDYSSIYEGKCQVRESLFGDVVIKIVDDSSDNDLATNEIRVLQHLQSMDAEEWRHFPQLLDSFTTDGRKGLVFRRIYGPSLLEVRKSRRYRVGVHRKDMVWMLNRALRAANYFHALGVIHGNIEPSHMMIQPIPHNLIFVDWSYAAVQPAKTGEGFKVHTEVYSPPEVLEKKPPIPASDIYSIGKVMIWLLGGNPRTNEIPEDVEEKLARLLLDCVTESPQQRPQSAWKLQGRLIHTIEDLWGPRKYRAFDWDWDDVDLDIDFD